jgi:hypothetical protein
MQVDEAVSDAWKMVAYSFCIYQQVATDSRLWVSVATCCAPEIRS